jgi:Tfp pilus assembly protein FimV
MCDADGSVGVATDRDHRAPSSSGGVRPGQESWGATTAPLPAVTINNGAKAWQGNNRAGQSHRVALGSAATLQLNIPVLPRLHKRRTQEVESVDHAALSLSPTSCNLPLAPIPTVPQVRSGLALGGGRWAARSLVFVAPGRSIPPRVASSATHPFVHAP